MGRRGPRRFAGLAADCLVVASLAAGCGGPILANPPLTGPLAPAAASPAAGSADPLPIVFPRDDGPHDRLTEWWYYTGHLRGTGGERFGFEFVVFRAERGDFPVAWASHLALTDETRGRFTYAQRNEIGPQVDGSPRPSSSAHGVPAGPPSGFALTVQAPVEDGARAGTLPRASWAMSGGSGRGHLVAALTAGEAAAAGAAFGLDLDLGETAPVLHGRDGWIDFGPGGGSYYYSRPRMPARGSLTLGGHDMTVVGEAWFDHQWGDFISEGSSGWDWFAVNLSDGSDLVVSRVRAPAGSVPPADGTLAYGTLRRPDGSVIRLADAFHVNATGSWTSPHTGAVYPAGWRISVPGERLTIDLSPTVADQELDTRPTTGVAYWEGSQHVNATRGGTALSGEAYVELTDYAPAIPAPAPSTGSPAPSTGSPAPSPAESAP